MSTNAPPPVETIPISRLFCSPTNPRKNDAAIPHVAGSIRRFGWQQPIVARRTGEVIAGNTRLKAAQSLGMTEVPVWWFDGDDLAAVAFNIADNRTHEFAEWDDAELAKLMEQLKAEDSLDGVGYSEDDIDALVWLGICSAVMFVPSLLRLLERARGIGRNTTMASFHAAGSLGFLLGPVGCGALVDLGGGSLAGYEIAFTVAGLSVAAGAWLGRRDAPGSRGHP